MTLVPLARTNAEVLERVHASGLPCTTLARTLDDLEIVSIQTGGTRQPPVLITAGAHAGEPSGVYGALELLTRIHCEFETHIVPLRDPFAWQGLERCLSFALREPVTIDDHAHLDRMLTTRGQVIFRDGDLLIAVVNGLGFCTMPTPVNTTGPRDMERRLRALLRSQPALIQSLQGIRLLLPSNLPGVDGCGDFTQAFTLFVTPEGEVIDLNRAFDHTDAPLEVRCVRDLIHRLQPGLTIDLHEGQGDKFYLFVSALDNPLTQRVADAMLQAATAAGAELYMLSDLSRRVDAATISRLRETSPGLIMGNTHSDLQGSSLGTYALRYGAALTTETGRWTSLRRRVDWQVQAALAGLTEFQRARY